MGSGGGIKLTFSQILSELQSKYGFDQFCGSGCSLFAQHARKLKKQYPSLQPISNDFRNGFKIKAKCKWGIDRAVLITPTGEYPNMPPTVRVLPFLTSYPCFSKKDGTLYFIFSKGSAKSPWENLLKRMPNDLLFVLMNDLKKYDLTFEGELR